MPPPGERYAEGGQALKGLRVGIYGTEKLLPSAPRSSRRYTAIGVIAMCETLRQAAMVFGCCHYTDGPYIAVADMRRRSASAYDPLPALAARAISSEMIPKYRWLLVPFLVALGGCGPSALPDRPLFAGVEGQSYVQGSQLIQNRLNARFPKGSSTRELRDYLDQQGLQIEPSARSSTPDSGVASFKYGGPPCGSQVRVMWESDGAGKIKSIDALYGDTGCP